MIKYFETLDARQKHVIDIFFIAILILFPMRNVFLGIDLTDTGYSISKFMQFWENPDFSTYISNMIGALLFKLPIGDTLIGMRVYSSLLISILSVVVFLIFKHQIPSFILFIGEICAICLCWCPTVVLYNYLTYFFMNFALIMFYIGLKHEKLFPLFLSGVLISLNIFTRFPNVMQIVFISIIWFYAWISRFSIKKTIIKTLVFLSGLIISFILIYIFISVKYGDTAYIDMIKQLFAMGEDYKSYTPQEMLLNIVRRYYSVLKPVVLLLSVGFLSNIAFNYLHEKFYKIQIVLLCVLILGMFYLFYILNIFNFDYNSYSSIFKLLVMFIIVSMCFAVFIIFNRKMDNNIKLVAFIMLLQTAITPIGTDNHIYANINNMFLLFPFMFSCLYYLLANYKKEFVLSFRERTVKLSSLPFKIILMFFVSLVFIQTIFFGLNFNYSDGKSGNSMNYKVLNNEVLVGMRSEASKADALMEISTYCNENALFGRSAIFYGSIPLLSFVLDMPVAISAIWPSLRAVSVSSFEQDLNKVSRNIDDRPVVIVSNQAQLKLETNDLADKKVKVLKDLLVKNSYKMTFFNSMFYIYE